jgi:addiction module RelE/StbE family toxin
MTRRYTRTALAEIDSIYSYLLEENPLAAKSVLAALEKTVTRLETFPYSAVATSIADVRVATIYPFPYLIFYTVEVDTVVIRNIRHAARRRPRGT